MAVDFDTIIIGAGLSGIAAGIRLAYFDRSVCILERHTTVGGLNSFYRLRHRNYDVGLHAVTNYAPPGTKSGPLSKLLRQLRLSWSDFDLSPQWGSAVAFPGVRLEFSNDFGLLESEIQRAFPNEIEGFRLLTRRILEHDELNLYQTPSSARNVVAGYLHDPLLIDLLFCPLMFYGSATAHDMDFNQFVVMFKSIYQEGFGRPRAGVRQIMKQVTRQYKSLGGELRLRSGVRKIVHDQGRVLGVELDSGTTLTANTVLSSAGAAETIRLCGLESPDYAPGEITFLETLFVLKRPPADLGYRTTVLFYSHTPEFYYDNPAEPIDLRSGIICSPNNFEYSEPLEEGMIRVTALANSDYWFQQPSEEVYQKEKLAWGDRLLDSASPFLPEIRPDLIDRDAFTPRTINKFTGHERGVVYGAPVKKMAGETPLERLYLCGTDQGFLGIVGSMLSGITIANLHVLKS